jgi:hypothetical protein
LYKIALQISLLQYPPKTILLQIPVCKVPGKPACGIEAVDKEAGGGRDTLFYRICFVVRADSQEYNCSVRQAVTKTVFALRDIFTLFADNKDNPKITVNAGTAAADQIQPAADIAKRLCVHIRVSKNSFDPAFNGFTDRCIAA